MPIDWVTPQGWCCQTFGICLPGFALALINAVQRAPIEQNIAKHLLDLPENWQVAANRIQNLTIYYSSASKSDEVLDFVDTLLPLAEKYRDVSDRAATANFKFLGAALHIADVSLPAIYDYVVQEQYSMALEEIGEINKELTEALDAYTGLKNNVTQIYTLTLEKVKAAATHAKRLEAKKYNVQPLSTEERLGLLGICLASFSVGFGFPVCGGLLTISAAHSEVVNWNGEYDNMISQFQMIENNLVRTTQFIEKHRNQLGAIINSLELAGKEGNVVRRMKSPLGILKRQLDSAASRWRSVAAMIDNYSAITGTSENRQIAN